MENRKTDTNNVDHNEYEAPQVESVVTSEELDREVMYAAASGTLIN